MADRVDEWRIGHRIDDIVTNWEPYVDVDVEADGSVFSVVGDGVSSAWDWAFGGNDAPDPGPVEVPTRTTTTTTTVPQPDRRRRAAAVDGPRGTGTAERHRSDDDGPRRMSTSGAWRRLVAALAVAAVGRGLLV